MPQTCRTSILGLLPKLEIMPVGEYFLEYIEETWLQLKAQQILRKHYSGRLKMLLQRCCVRETNPQKTLCKPNRLRTLDPLLFRALLQSPFTRGMITFGVKVNLVCVCVFKPFFYLQNFRKGPWISPEGEVSCKFFVRNTAPKISHIAAVPGWAFTSQPHLRAHLWKVDSNLHLDFARAWWVFWCFKESCWQRAGVPFFQLPVIWRGGERVGKGQGLHIRKALLLQHAQNHVEFLSGWLVSQLSPKEGKRGSYLGGNDSNGSWQKDAEISWLSQGQNSACVTQN